MKNSTEDPIFAKDMTATIKNAVNYALLLQHRAVGNKIAYWDEIGKDYETLLLKNIS